MPPNFPISSEFGINKVIGYTSGEPDFAGEMTVYSGEIDNWPWYNSPITRFAKTYEYWRDMDYILPIDSYIYDFEYNKIIFMDDTNVSITGDYIIEYETMNEPFPVGIDFNPLELYPEDLMVCIVCDENIIEEIPKKVTTYASDSNVRDSIVYIGAEVMTEEDNRMESADMLFYINRLNMAATGSEQDNFIPGSGEVVNISDDIAYDYVLIASGDIIENEYVIANGHRINDHAMIRSSGYLKYISGNIPGAYYISGITDDTGFEYISYVAPTVVKTSIDVSILAIADGLASGNISISLIPDVTESVYAMENMEISETEVGVVSDWEANPDPLTVICHDTTYPLFEAGTTHIVVPSGCLSPTSIQLYNAVDYMVGMYSGSIPEFLAPHAFYTSNSQLLAVFNNSGNINDTTDVIINYIPDLYIAKLDGRVRYVYLS